MKVYVLVGPSASGKTTIMDALVDGIYNEAFTHPIDIKKIDNLEKIITCTTRRQRAGEVDGVHYDFLTDEQFEEAKRKGEMAEETENYGIRYGILAKRINEISDKGKNAIVCLNMYGAKMLKSFYGEENVVSIYMYRDLKDIVKSLSERNTTDADKKLRFESAKEELKNISLCDKVVYNIFDAEAAVNSLSSIIKETNK